MNRSFPESRHIHPFPMRLVHTVQLRHSIECIYRPKCDDEWRIVSEKSFQLNLECEGNECRIFKKRSRVFHSLKTWSTVVCAEISMFTLPSAWDITDIFWWCFETIYRTFLCISHPSLSFLLFDCLSPSLALSLSLSCSPFLALRLYRSHSLTLSALFSFLFSYSTSIFPHESCFFRYPLFFMRKTLISITPKKSNKIQWVRSGSHLAK